MVLSAKSDKRLRKTDKADAECTMIDYRLDSVVFTKLFTVKPECSHKERELFLESGLLEVESLVELPCSKIECPVKSVEEFVDSVLRVADVHTLDGEFDDIDGCERKVTATDRGLWSESVLEYTCTASHGSNLVLISLWIICSPELVMVERSVEVYEVREESSCRNLACELVKIVVAVLWKVAYSSLLFPDLDREDCCRAITNTFVCCVENFADHATSLC